MRSLVRVVLVVSIALGVALGVVACKLKKGDHCQVDEDCESGLVCSTLGFCDVTKSSTSPDAMPFDARPPAPDSGPDATPAIDAAVDARPIDAPLPDAP